MKRGGGKQKGAAFEREVCRVLSLWITSGERQDCFWRSAMSGGRATIAHGRDVRQCGDIAAVAQEGYEFANAWFVECKHVRSLDLDSFIIKGVGLLRKFWDKARKEAKRHRKDPMIIARQNRWPDIVVTRTNHAAHWTPPISTVHRYQGVDIYFLSDLLEVSYDRSNHSRPTINRQSTGRIQTRVHAKTAKGRKRVRPRNHSW